MGVAAALFVIAGLIAWFRLAPAARDVMWAEDARVFVQQRLQSGLGATLFQPYDGYLHVVPRILVDVAVRLSTVDDLARVVTGLSCALAGLVAALVFVYSRDLVLAAPLRAALALVTVLAPLAPLEVSGNLANLHWYLLWLTPFVLLARSRTRRGAVASTVVLGLVGATEIQALLFLPLVLFRRPRGRDLWPATALALTLVAQFATAASSTRAPVTEHRPSFVQVVLGFLAEPVTGTWIPSSSGAGVVLGAVGWVAAVMCAVPFAAATVVAWRSSHRPHRLLAVVALLAAVALWAVDVVVNPSDLTRFSFSEPERIAVVGFARYAVVPSMLLVATLLVALDAILASNLDRRRLVVGVCSGLLAVGLLWHVQQPNVLRATGPSWSDAIEDGRNTCELGAATLDLPAVPDGWGAVVPCSVVVTR